ncbi:endonuclease/exonuclease/phosphatase family protein [Micrococcaceae bacterium Sec5.7]
MTASAPVQPAASPKRGLAFVGRMLALLAALPVATLSVFRAVTAEWPTQLVQLLSFTPWLVLPAALALLLALLGRRGWVILLTSVLLAAQVFWLFPLDYGRYAPLASAGAGVSARAGRLLELKAMNINSEFGEADAAEIVRLVSDNGIGLLTIQEHSQSLEDRLAAEGLARLLPNRVSDPTDDGAGSAVYSVHPLQQAGVLPNTAFQIPTVRLTLEDSAGSAILDVTNVHALPPVDGRIAQWRSDLAAVGRLAARPGNQLLIGDFNATYDHSEFRQLLDAGADGREMVDVGTSTGSRLLPTWPMKGPLLPGIALDHMVTSPHIQGTGYAVHRVAGTDHGAILATLGVPETR